MAHKRKRKEDIKKLISVIAYVYSFNWAAACCLQRERMFVGVVTGESEMSDRR